MDTLVKHHIQLLALKEGIRLDGQQDLQTKVMVTLFGLFADIERALISLEDQGSAGSGAGLREEAGPPSGEVGEI